MSYNLALDSRQEERAIRLHDEAIIVNGLAALGRMEASDLDDFSAAGITAVNVCLAINQGFFDSCKLIARLLERLDKVAHSYRIVRVAQDVMAAKREGQVGVMMGFQGGGPLENDPGLVRLFRALGVTIIQIVYSSRNAIGDGCHERTDCGLSHYGLEVVSEMNRHGVVIDLSHVGRRTVLETIEASRHPVIFSHANAYALCPIPRNRTDEEIQLLAKKGGVIGVNPLDVHVRKGGDSTLDDLGDHVDYIVKLVGTDHIGIGLDFARGTPADYALRDEVEGASPWPWPATRGLDTIRDLPNFTRLLVKRGYNDTDIRKVLGGNFMRVFREVLG